MSATSRARRRLIRDVLQEMNAILSMIERMRARADVGVVDQEQSWMLVIPRGEIYLCEVTVPHTVLEWFASVHDRVASKVVWSDWEDYEGYDNTPKADLETSMADDVDRFVDQVTKKPLTLPLIIDDQEE